MKGEHASDSTPSQMLSLSKVSQRRMLEPQECPLCGYAAEHSSPTLDDHITKHLHGFALRCLPWGTGGDDADSVNAKSADASHLSDADDDDNSVDKESPVYLNATESDSPDRLFDLFVHNLNQILSGTQVNIESSIIERLKEMVEVLGRHKSFLETQSKSVAENFRLDVDDSYPVQLSSLEPDLPLASHSSKDNKRLGGKLRFYPDPSESRASLPSPAMRLYEATVSHLLKITRILYQATTQWGLNVSLELQPRALSPFEAYRQTTLGSGLARKRRLDAEVELLRSGLTDAQKAKFADRETDQIAAYVASNTEETRKILEDELNALDDIISEVANSQRTQSIPTLMRIDPKDINRFELTMVYAHPDAKVDIVFVHGLNGDAVRTWQSKNGTFWPSELLPTSLGSAHVRILVYGYNTNYNTFGNM